MVLLGIHWSEFHTTATDFNCNPLQHVRSLRVHLMFINDVQAEIIKSDFLQIYMIPLSEKYISLLTANKIFVSVFSKSLFLMAN